MNEIIKRGQIEGNKFTGLGIEEDGFYGAETEKLGFWCLQRAMYLDYGARIDIDGIWGVQSIETFGSHYVEHGEEQQMVKALQILLLLKGYDPGEVDGVFGNNVLSAVKAFQSDASLVADGVAGGDTFGYLSGAIKNFDPNEFRCNCGRCNNSGDCIPELKMKAQLLRNMIGEPMIINSGYRCPAENDAVGGEQDSLHMRGRAFDFDLGQHLTSGQIGLYRGYAHQCGLDVGSYYQSGFLHCDNSRTGDFIGD